MLAALLAWGRHHFGNFFHAWRALRIPANNPSFSDTRTITHSIDCLLSGRNPFIDRSFDPWHRLYNYPPIWLDLRYLGVRSTSSKLLGSLFAMAGLGACIAMFRARTWVTRAILFFAVLSWPLLFAIERGNCDLVIFALLIFGVLGTARLRSGWMTALRSLLIVLLTVLKIYPVAAVAAMVRSRRAILTASLTGVLAVAALIVTCGHDLHYVLANTPQEAGLSFGSFAFLLVMGRHLSSGFRHFIVTHESVATAFGLISGSIAAGLGALGRGRLRKALPEMDLNTARGFLAMCGLAIYCLSFARGSSYNYRLIFLLAPLMYLIEDLNRGESHRSLPAALVLLAFLWSPYLNSSSLQEVLDLAVFAVGCAWLGATLMNHLQAREGVGEVPTSLWRVER